MTFDAVGKLVYQFPRQEQAHFILNGTSLRRSGTKTFSICFFCHKERAGSWGQSDPSVQRTDWTSDHSQSHS